MFSAPVLIMPYFYANVTFTIKTNASDSEISAVL